MVDNKLHHQFNFNCNYYKLNPNHLMIFFQILITIFFLSLFFSSFHWTVRYMGGMKETSMLPYKKLSWFIFFLYFFWSTWTHWSLPTLVLNILQKYMDASKHIHPQERNNILMKFINCIFSKKTNFVKKNLLFKID